MPFSALPMLTLWTMPVLFSAGLSPASASRIPIGALFNSETRDLSAVFQREIERHNNGSKALFLLDGQELVVNSSNSYQVGRLLCSTFSSGIFILFGGFTSTSVHSFSRTFHLPHVTTGAPVYRNGTSLGQYVLHMRPLYEEAMMDIIRYYSWTRILYIYDTIEGLSRIERIYREIVRKTIFIEVESLHIIDVDGCYTALRTLDQRQPIGNKYLVLDISTTHKLQIILNQIQRVGMNRDNYHYLIGGLAMDELDLRDFTYGGVNITGFTLVDTSTYYDALPVGQRDDNSLTAPNKLTLETALTVDAVAVIIESLRMTLDSKTETRRNTFRRGQVYYNITAGIQCRTAVPSPLDLGHDIQRHLKQVKLTGRTGPVAFDENGHRKDFHLSVLELNINSDPKQIGVWTSSNRLNITKELGGKIPFERVIFYNKTRIVTTIISPPYLIERRQPDDGRVLAGNDRYEGYCADLALAIARIVRFEYELRLVRDNKYGAKINNGSWNGMVGELTTLQADLAVAPLTISSVRERVIDFSKPFMDLGISIMIKKPEKQKPGVFSFMDPLSGHIWLCIGVSYVGVSFILFLVSRFSPYEWQIEDRLSGPSFTNDFTVLNSLWFSLGAFMRQGCDMSPRSLSGRIVGSAWWFFTLIIISSYTANLAAFLTVERMLTPIQNVDDLAKQTEIHYGSLDAGSTKDFFMMSKIPIYTRMWKFMDQAIPTVFVNRTEDGVQRVRNSKGKYAFLLESTMNDYYNQRKPCNTMKVGANLDAKGYGVATPIGSDLREPVSLAVLQLLETGVLQKFHKKWWYDKGECSADESKASGSSHSALTLSNVAGIFYILIGGLGLSMIISLIEFLYKSKRRARRHKKTYMEAKRPRMDFCSCNYSGPSQVVTLPQYSEIQSPPHTQV